LKINGQKLFEKLTDRQTDNAGTPFTFSKMHQKNLNKFIKIQKKSRGSLLPISKSRKTLKLILKRPPKKIWR
jgi:hypothetical protein